MFVDVAVSYLDSAEKTSFMKDFLFGLVPVSQPFLPCLIARLMMILESETVSTSGESGATEESVTLNHIVTCLNDSLVYLSSSRDQWAVALEAEFQSIEVADFFDVCFHSNMPQISEILVRVPSITSIRLIRSAYCRHHLCQTYT